MFLMGCFATRLWRMSRSYDYVTPGDLLEGYYQSRTLRTVVSGGQLIFCFPYMIAQISGVGLAVSTLTNGFIPSWVGCIYCAFIVGLYVFFGGFKSQAWVDTMQGIMFTVILWITVVIMMAQNGGGIEGFFTGLENAGNRLLYYATDPDAAWGWKMYLSYFWCRPSAATLPPMYGSAPMPLRAAAPCSRSPAPWACSTALPSCCP